jgi:hypothetical protein
MSVLPRIQQIAPLAQVKKSGLPLPVSRREKKPVNQSAQKDWQEALHTPSEALHQAFVVPAVALRHQEDADGSEQGKDKQDQKMNGTCVKTKDQTTDDSLPFNMNRLGGLIAAFVVHSVAHGSWAVQIPIAHTLLEETVLHMRCEQETLTLRFETADWRSRETLMLHAPTLLRRLRQSLPQLVEIVLLTH